jgi:Apea-like HEPN
MPDIWFPCYLQPISVFNFGQWEVRPGLTAGPILASEKAVWDSVSKSPFKESFEPNFLVRIDKDIFEKAVIERLRGQSHDIDRWLEEIPPELRDDLPWIPDDLFRWIIVSMSLCRTFDQIVTPAARYYFQKGDKQDELISSGCVATHAAYDRSFYTQVPHHPGEAGPLDSIILDKVATTIELYYQPILRRHDPVSVALNSFWAFLFSRFADQAYMSLVIILEALLSTSASGITRQISERAATLVGQSPQDSRSIAKAIRKLYQLRSQIAHGDLELKKGPIKWDKTAITATMTIVSIPMLKDMASYSVAVLRRMIESEEVMSAMDKPKRERKRSLDKFFSPKRF